MGDVFEDEAEETVSIQEYLKDVEEQELEADMVLGGDEGKECTYKNGYMKRQAIFSCLTCTPDGNAGVCIACSLSCHDGHEVRAYCLGVFCLIMECLMVGKVVELWTKRKFRCDCGNSKFGKIFCKLMGSKDIVNGGNSYNHNFKGLYCTCYHPYPDPDNNNAEQEEMIQCCICEDWLHEEHTGVEIVNVPRDEDGEPLYEDFICGACSSACPFLMHYDATSGKQKGKRLLGEDNACLDLGVEGGSAPMFLKRGWRDELCRCEKCCCVYEEKGIGFLLDKEDSIAHYEKTAKDKREQKLQDQDSADLCVLNRLTHAEKIEILSGIADMKNEILTFLQSYDPSKPVTADDVHRVFDRLAKKRQRKD